MPGPQLEDGFTMIANELYDALIGIRISGEENQCLRMIIRKTYGWGKKEDIISLSQFTTATGMRKQHVVRSINKLKDKNMIVTKKGNDGNVTYCVNKHYGKWRALPKKVTLPKMVIGVTKNGDMPLPILEHSLPIVEERKIKETKEREPPKEIFLDIPIKLGQRFAVSENYVNHLQEIYPDIDIKQQLRECREWNYNNPLKRKTERGIKKHICSWMSDEQAKAVKHKSSWKKEHWKSSQVGSQESFEGEEEQEQRELTPKEELWRFQRRRTLCRNDDSMYLSQEEAERMAELIDIVKTGKYKH